MLTIVKSVVLYFGPNGSQLIKITIYCIPFYNLIPIPHAYKLHIALNFRYLPLAINL